MTHKEPALYGIAAGVFAVAAGLFAIASRPYPGGLISVYEYGSNWLLAIGGIPACAMIWGLLRRKPN